MGARKMIVIYDDANTHNSDGKLTTPVILICITVASAGLMFGYETGVYGDVTTMQAFLKKFFPSVYRRMNNNAKQQDQFCIYDSGYMSAYASSLYLAGIFSALLAGRLTTSAGRKGALIIGGIIYLIGVSLHALAVNLQILILGRILVGFGIGFTNQAAPIYLAEIAPTKWRGAIGTGFPLFFEIGIFAAKWINIFLVQFSDDNSWRIALGLSAFPAITMTVIAFFIPDTPCSLIQRGKVQDALKSLNQFRSVDVDTENELKYLINYHEAMRSASEKPYHLLFEKRYRPQLLLSVVIPVFRHFTGINLITSVGPLLFRSLKYNSKEILFVYFIQGGIVILSVLVATYLIDKIGRRILILEGGVQLFICHLVMAILMTAEIQNSGTSYISKSSAMTALVVMGLINAAYLWSWGTMIWILPSELLSMEVRPTGQGLSLAINFAFQFAVTQTMYPMLCNFKYGTFLFYAVLVVIMTIFVILFLPETKKIPLESMDIIWRSHWYWSQFVHGTNTLLKPEIDDLSSRRNF